MKLNVYLTDLADFPLVNEVMAGYFDEPYPARAAIGVASLPKDARVEMEGVMVTSGVRRRTSDFTRLSSHGGNCRSSAVARLTTALANPCQGR